MTNHTHTRSYCNYKHLFSSSQGCGSAEKMGGSNGSVSVCRSGGLGSRLQVGLRSVPRVFLLGLGLKGSSYQGTRKRVETFDAIEASSRNCHTIAPSITHQPSQVT